MKRSATASTGSPRPCRAARPARSDDQIWFRKEIGTLVALIGFVALLIGVFDGLLEAAVFSHLRLPEIADGTMPAQFSAKDASSSRRWTAAFVLSAFIPALTYYPAFALGGTFVSRPPICPRASPTRSWSGPSSTA